MYSRIAALTLFAIAALARGSTIAFSTSCNGGGRSIPFCSTPNPVTGLPAAWASVTVPGPGFVTSGFIQTQAWADGAPFGPYSSQAYASYQAEFSITISGGTGSGYFMPVDRDGLAIINEGSDVHAGLIGLQPIPSSAPCYSQPGCASFVFGQPANYTLFLVSVSNGRPTRTMGIAHFSLGQSSNFRFWDAAGFPLSGITVEVTEAQTPEPSTASFLIIAVALVAFRIGGNRANLRPLRRI